jgi:hypothetical protein
MALVGVNDLSSHPTKKPKGVLFQVCRTQFGAICAGKLHLKEPVVTNENDMVVCGRIEFVGRVRGNIGVSRRMESARRASREQRTSRHCRVGLTAICTNP